MGLEVHREFRGNFQLVGRFVGEGLDAEFAYEDSFLRNPDAQPLSVSLPLRAEPFARREYGGFFEGLIPEGEARTELARRFRLPPSDYLGMLERLGGECIGALLFRNPQSNDGLEPSYGAFSDEALASLLTSSPLAVAGQMERSRLSLTGMQSKFGVYVDPRSGLPASDPSSWLEPRGSAPSTHIVKVADERLGTLPSNELACMELARACGIASAECAASPYGGNVFVSERYDRVVAGDPKIIDGRPAPMRLHQEDLCQALGWPSYLKYEMEDTVSYAIVVGNLLARASSDAVGDKRAFVRRTAFDYLVGNCDNHLKNHSLIYSPSWTSRRLAPSYDIVSTTILGFERKMGFSIGDHQLIDEIDRDDWAKFGKDVGAGPAYAQKTVAEVADRVKASAPKLLRALPEGASHELERIMQDMKGRIGNMGGVSS